MGKNTDSVPPGGFEVIADDANDKDIDPRIIAYYDPSSPVSEQYRILRTNVCALGTDQPVKAMVVTSSTHGEGKSISAVNFAIALAAAHDRPRILLADADLRRANVHKYLGMGHGPGIADIVTAKAPVESVLRESGIQGLTILTAGMKVKNPSELLGSQAFAELVKCLRSRFDYVIFDAPPVIPVTDAGLVAGNCDGALVVVQAGRTPRGVVNHCTGLLRQARARILGYVMTNVRYHIPAYIYRYL